MYTLRTERRGQAMTHSTAYSSTVSPISPLDRREIERLIAKNYVGLRRLISQRAGDPEVGADLLNEAICTTWEKWQAGLIEQPNQIAAYVFQVAMNLLRNYRRNIGVRPDKRVDAAAIDLLPAADNEAVELRIAGRVKKLLHNMGSARDRLVLTRFYLDEESKESICAELGLESAQFDKVLHRARGRLRELIESEGLRRSDLFSVLL
jgi:RNA polymerase sigma-70 factor, ECF subfamily